MLGLLFRLFMLRKNSFNYQQLKYIKNIIINVQCYFCLDKSKLLEWLKFYLLLIYAYELSITLFRKTSSMFTS